MTPFLTFCRLLSKDFFLSNAKQWRLHWDCFLKNQIFYFKKNWIFKNCWQKIVNFLHLIHTAGISSWQWRSQMVWWGAGRWGIRLTAGWPPTWLTFTGNLRIDTNYNRGIYRTKSLRLTNLKIYLNFWGFFNIVNCFFGLFLCFLKIDPSSKRNQIQ